nr:DNA helicase [Tanacetum cinerariifolium]
MTYFGGQNSDLRRDIVEGLIDLLDTHNGLVQLFRIALEKFQDTHVPNFKVRLYNVVGTREYEPSTGDMLGAIVYETGPKSNMDYDIVLEERSGGGRVVLPTYQVYPEYMKLLLQDRHFLENIRAYNQMFSMTSLGAQVNDSINNGRGPYVFKISEERSGYPQRVNKLHSSYRSLQFPLLFIYGQDGYSKDLKMMDPTRSSSDKKRLTMLVFYSYQLHNHANCYNYLSRTGRLFQQYVVTAFCAIEQNRIDYVHEHQNDIMNEYLSGIYDAINRGDSDGSDYGLRLILPQSFTGGPHYMYSHYLDALPICRVHGNPSFFYNVYL